MFGLPLHPVVVHLPIALAALMPLVAGGVLLAWALGWLDRRAWVIVAGLQLILFLSSYAAQWTGEAQEDRVEAFVSHAALEAHEEAATQFLWASGVVLVITAAAIGIPGDRWRKWTATGAVVGTLVVLGFGIQVGHAGGKLVYQEGAANAYIDGSAQNGTDGESSGPVREDEVEEHD
jgi:uncharacterized membrane protein